MSRLHLAVLTTGRQDWGVLRPLCAALQRDHEFRLEIIAGGMACSPMFGRPVDGIRELDMMVVAELDWDMKADSVTQASHATKLIGRAIEEQQPDALVVVGDRFETAAAALAATVLGIPIVHLYGGEETEGAIDNVLRHAITKLSHLHLVAHAEYRNRVVQMGEAPTAVHVVGSLGVDNLLNLSAPSRRELEAFLGISLTSPLGLVTIHPTTLSEGGEDELSAVVEVINTFSASWVITLPNADTGSERIRETLRSLSNGTNVVAVDSLGEARYIGLMRIADFVLGNSSSGITEAPSIGVPTINLGDRQKGRVRSPSIIDVACDPTEIINAIRHALAPEWRAQILTQPRPFGDGDAAARIVTVLKNWTPPTPPRKAFHPIPFIDPLPSAREGANAP